MKNLKNQRFTNNKRYCEFGDRSQFLFALYLHNFQVVEICLDAMEACTTSAATRKEAEKNVCEICGFFLNDIKTKTRSFVRTFSRIKISVSYGRCTARMATIQS